jgi:hypothetical protein
MKTGIYQDYINIFIKYQEIDYMKYIIFDENQLRLFNCLPKP